MSIKYNGKIIAGGYVPKIASRTEKGVVRLATEEEMKSGIAEDVVITPKQLTDYYATTSLDNLNEVGEARFNNIISDVNTKVSKSGDTMSGTLNLIGISDDNCQQRIVSGDYGVMFRNDNENFYMLLTNAGDPFGHWNDFRPFTLNFTGGYVTTETPTAGDDSSKIATTAFVKSVLSGSGTGLATYKKDSNGYIKFNNGIIINWGRVHINAATSATVTLPIAFTSTNYKVVGTIYNTDAGSQKNMGVNNYTTTSFKMYNGQGGVEDYDWIAIGY